MNRAVIDFHPAEGTRARRTPIANGWYRRAACRWRSIGAAPAALLAAGKGGSPDPTRVAPGGGLPGPMQTGANGAVARRLQSGSDGEEGADEGQ